MLADQVHAGSKWRRSRLAITSQCQLETLKQLAGSQSISADASLQWLIEISQIRRQLALPGGHQEAIRAQQVILSTDFDMIVVLATIVLSPDWPLFVGFATIGLVDCPRTRQGMVEYRDVVMEDVRIGFVEVNALLDEGLPIFVERNTAAVESARLLERAAGLDLKQIEAAVATGLLPLADGIT